MAPRASACAAPSACSTTAERLPLMRNMILADSPEERKRWADKLMPMQREDFVEIFRTMDGLPVTIRLLDPPLHEFLPSIEELVNEVSRLKEFNQIINALEQLPGTLTIMDPELYKYVPSIETVAREFSEFKAKGLDQKLLAQKEKVLRRVRVLYEYNPMLGNRGVRCGISFPEIYDMQIQAIFEAAAIALQGKGRRAAGDHGAQCLHPPGVGMGQTPGGEDSSRGGKALQCKN